MREKKQKKEERRRRKAAAKAAAGARAVGEQDEQVSRAPRPARKSLSDWRGKLGMAGLGMGSGGGAGLPRAASSRSSAGDVSSLVGSEKVVVQKREAYGEKFYRQVRTKDKCCAGAQLHGRSPRSFFSGVGCLRSKNLSSGWRAIGGW